MYLSTYAVMATSLPTELKRATLTMLWIPVLFPSLSWLTEVLCSQSVSSSSANCSRALVGTHCGQPFLDDSHGGPRNYISDEKSCWAETPLVRRSAGLSSDGVNDHELAGNAPTISETRCEINGLD